MSRTISRPARWVLIGLFVGGALLILICVAGVFYWGLQHFPLVEETNPGMPVGVIKLTPTVFASPPPSSACETIVSSGDVQVAVSLPVSLTVGSESFPVVAVELGQQGWTYPSEQAGVATWVCGTVVNYVAGLEPTPENAALLADLRPGDEIKLHLSSGVVLFFHFAEQGEVAANEASVFDQYRPRLTLVLEKEGGAWQVATADYVAETESVQPPPAGTPAELGQPVRVGDAQVAVVKGHALRDAAGLLPGTMYYLVEFSLENVGVTSLDTGVFNMQLQDGAQNVYLLSPAASAVGEYGPLGAEIPAGSTVQATAGYLVPEALVGPTLIWTFTPQPGSELRAGVSIPYAAEAPTAGHAQVTITQAFLDGNMLVIEGEVQNTGDGPLTVELGHISLTSSAGMSALRSAAPPLPWTVEPGQTQMIELQYEKPGASTALLTLLGYSFDIAGL